MKTSSLQKQITNGIAFGIIVIFLALIGFTVTGPTLVEKIGGRTLPAGAIPSIPSLIIFLAFIGLWNGWSSARNNAESPLIIKNAFKSALVSGAVTGVLVMLYSFVVGSIYSKGVDMRTYLSLLSPESIRYFLFRQPWLLGAILHLVLNIVSALAGALLAALADRSSQKVAELRTFVSTRVKNSRFGKLQQNVYFNYILMGIVLLLLVVLPQTWGSYWNYIIGTVGIYVLLGLGMNIIVGYSGQLVLGYVAFFAIGAYAFALVTATDPHNLNWNFWIALVVAILASAASGVLIGLPLLRLRGDYLAIVTLGFGEIIRILLRSDWLRGFTLGPRGLRNLAGPTLFGRSFTSDSDYMYLIILAVLLALFLARRWQESHVGRAWLAVSQDETVAQATGVDTYKYKLLALAIGAAFAGLGGALFASRNQFTGPEDHTFMVSINVLCLVIVGGMGSIPGIFLGAFALKGLPEILRELENYRLLVFGALLVVMMVIRPEGLWPASRPKLEIPPPGEVREPPPLPEGGEA